MPLRAVFIIMALYLLMWSSYLVKGVFISESLYLENPTLKYAWFSLVTMDIDGYE